MGDSVSHVGVFGVVVFDALQPAREMLMDNSRDSFNEVGL